jgi:hypothetical protein
VAGAAQRPVQARGGVELRHRLGGAGDEALVARKRLLPAWERLANEHGVTTSHLKSSFISSFWAVLNGCNLCAVWATVDHCASSPLAPPAHPPPRRPGTTRESLGTKHDTEACPPQDLKHQRLARTVELHPRRLAKCIDMPTADLIPHCSWFEPAPTIMPFANKHIEVSCITWRYLPEAPDDDQPDCRRIGQ